MSEPSFTIQISDESGSSAVPRVPETAPAVTVGLRITLQDVSHSIPSLDVKGEEYRLVNNVAAYAEPFEMTALMGPSGSGKTTLLDLLAGRKTTGTTTGTSRFGNATPSPAYIKRYTGYVEQFDTLISSLTVEEMLMYTAELKRDRSEPYATKKQAVQDLMARLGLTGCANVKIGDPLTKGISGGQAKRTNIGIALIADPRVLFLDEPTSGLDSYNANEIVALMKRLAWQGTTVLTTIHSPSAEAFALFDRVLILSRGHTVYFGAQGEEAMQYARQYWPGADTHRLQCSQPEFLMDLVTDADRNGQTQALIDAYDTSGMKARVDSQVTEYVNTNQAFKSFCVAPENNKPNQGSSLFKSFAAPKSDVGSEESDLSSEALPTVAYVPTNSLALAEAERAFEEQLATRTATSTVWWFALWVLLKYRMRVNYKTVNWLLPRFLDKLAFSLVILTIYLRTGGNFAPDNLTNLSASMFMWVALPATGAAAYIPSLVLERRLFYRERADGLYHVGTYYLAKVVEELTMAGVISLIFSAYIFYGVILFFYSMDGQNAWANLGYLSLFVPVYAFLGYLALSWVRHDKR